MNLVGVNLYSWLQNKFHWGKKNLSADKVYDQSRKRCGPEKMHEHVASKLCLAMDLSL